MNFFSDIYYNIQYSLTRTIYKIGLYIRGDEHMQNHLDFMQMHFDNCINCEQEILKPDEQELVICNPCIRKTCLTFCETCNRKIYTDIDSQPTHLTMAHCSYCIETLTEEIKNELNHERVCIFNYHDERFDLYCMKNDYHYNNPPKK